MTKTQLHLFNNSWYKPGGTVYKRAIWYIINALVFNSYCFPFNGLKIFLLRLFGAQMGSGVVIKPKVNIKYPWKLKIGDHCWIGENVWIDNLDSVTIGNHVCISQAALLLSGNHNYKKTTFDLMVNPITLEDGVWIGAKAIVCGGVTAKEHAVLLVQSVAVNDLESFGIYRGNPAAWIKKRDIV